MSASRLYPVRVEARLDEPLNPGLWLVKWLLAIPHYIVLCLLWVAFFVLTVIAFFAILFTGVYPRAIFDFNVGVLRWTWRVAYYSYGALGTDRYPPFTLGPAPDYPATLEVDYPVRLSRGLVLVKWWLLAIPHYLVVSLFTSGGMLGWRDDLPGGGLFYTLDWGGLVGLLVLFAAFVLLFTGRYPRGIFDLVLGMQRWALRVAAYATLMTDAYPPFRLDAGPREPEPGEPASLRGPGEGASEPAPSEHTPTEHAPMPEHAPPADPRHRRAPSGGSIVAIVLGALLAFGALGAGAAGTTLAVFDNTRGADGFVSSAVSHVNTPTHALTVEEIEFAGQGVGFLREAVGQVRIQVNGGDVPLFAGIARQADAEAYLDGVGHERITRLDFGTRYDADISYERHDGTAPTLVPAVQTFWAAQVTGPGTQTLTWEIQPGDWAVVLMNADGSAPVAADIQVAGALPWLGDLATWLFVATGILLLAGGALLFAGIRLAARPAVPEAAPPGPVPAGRA